MSNFKNKTPIERFHELSALVEDDLKNDRRSKFFGVLIGLSETNKDVEVAFRDLRSRYIKKFSKKNNSASDSLDQNAEKNKTEQHEPSPRFLIEDQQRSNYKIGGCILHKGESIKIEHIGKAFPFRDNSRDANRKSRFTDKQLVCYLYYSQNQPDWTANEFMEASMHYASVLRDFIKNGVKVRHSAELASKIKAFPVLCDSRGRILGYSWVAVDDADGFYWYISHIQSPVDIENNMLINGLRVQCWRTHKRFINQEHLLNADKVLFKSNALRQLDLDSPSDHE